jgi:DNA-directed RNA polymerase specialized sigma24 family protein
VQVWRDDVGSDDTAAPVDARRYRLTELVKACEEENRRRSRGEAHRDLFSRELFRRAICDREPTAWESLFNLYRGLVTAWVRQHPAAERVPAHDDCVNLVFERFWVAVGPDRFSEFPSAASLLKYLKVCVHAVLIDEVRAQRTAQQALSSRPLEDGPAAAMEDSAMAANLLTEGELWQAITQEVTDGAERLLLYLSAALDLSPRQIHARYPSLYPTVQDVYRMKRNVLDRLRRSRVVRERVAYV